MTKKRIVKKWADVEKLAVENILLKEKIKDTRILEMSEAHFKQQSEFWRLQCYDTHDQWLDSMTELIEYREAEDKINEAIDRYTEEIGKPLNFFKKRRLIKERKTLFLLKKAFLESKAK
ncbi:hypothetical protein [Carnobacterium maltaromaticum]|uniref:hypothetical protein n=1 Tax=Carnobacterium maltaromaticum TaxID=2751 RepID=UPI0012FB6A18|nr:hypothetical protein [Carnobacterium maltaromaticum]